jgi:hypothetical protein
MNRGRLDREVFPAIRNVLAVPFEHQYEYKYKYTYEKQIQMTFERDCSPHIQPLEEGSPAPENRIP